MENEVLKSYDDYTDDLIQEFCNSEDYTENYSTMYVLEITQDPDSEEFKIFKEMMQEKYEGVKQEVLLKIIEKKYGHYKPFHGNKVANA